MYTQIKIAWRNIVRNKRRSILTISAVGFGLGALIFLWAFVDGAHFQMIENYTSLLCGHLQIHKKGFQQNPKLELYIENSGKIVNQIKTIPSIKAITKRIRTAGLLSSAESSAGVIILGIEPDKEKLVSSIWRHISLGKIFNKDDNKAIIVGDDLAKNLNVSLGEKVVIMSQALDGSIAAGAYELYGILNTGVDEVDKGIALITYHAAEELFYMNNKTSEIAIRLNSAEHVKDVSEQIKHNLKMKQDLEILTWEEISPMLQQWIEFDKGFILVIVFVVIIVVGIGILNTVLMGVLERKREFGILLAIGCRRREIVCMVAWESIFLGIIGIILGLLLGITITLHFSNVGIDLRLFANALNSFYIDSFIYPKLMIDHIFFSICSVLITSVFVSIYPAFHAANLNPIEAIRSV